MFDAMYIGATGMQAQQQGVDTVANNLANVNTPGFKKSRVSFVDLMRQVPGPGGSTEASPIAEGIAVGAGVGLAGVDRIFDAGALRESGSMFDLAIQGDGFLEVELPDGERGYIRGGTLRVTPEGVLSTQTGAPLHPRILVPPEASGFEIAPDGRVFAALPSRRAPVEIGRLELVRFTNPSALEPRGAGVYRATPGSGEPMAGPAGEVGAGALAQGFLEASNVELVDEMVSLMIAQRAYEASVKVVQASDEMLGMVNGLRR